jgi:hypothetical protein
MVKNETGAKQTMQPSARRRTASRSMTALLKAACLAADSSLDTNAPVVTPNAGGEDKEII